MSDRLVLLPDDRYNQELIARVHPPKWDNPEPASQYNLLVIGSGTAGLVAAVGAASMGARVALVENYLMGGDCLNFGCVPSKALIRSARAVYQFRLASEFGIKNPTLPEIDFSKAMERMRCIRSRISQHDSQQKLTELGVHLFFGQGKFEGRSRFAVNDRILRFRRALVATGARPARPDIPGLHEAGYLTNETIFSLTEKPEHLLVLGGGPVGCELAQVFRRLGSQVTVVQRAAQLLPREDPVAAEVLAQAFQKEGIRVLLGSQAKKAWLSGSRKQVEVDFSGGTELITADEVLVAAGRVPNVQALDLEAAGIQYDLGTGIRVNDFLQSFQPENLCSRRCLLSL